MDTLQAPIMHVVHVHRAGKIALFINGETTSPSHPLYTAALSLIDNISIPDTNDFVLGDKDFTMEFFVQGLKPQPDAFRLAIKEALKKQGLLDDEGRPL